jgi:hypothetical protein
MYNHNQNQWRGQFAGPNNPSFRQKMRPQDNTQAGQGFGQSSSFVTESNKGQSTRTVQTNSSGSTHTVQGSKLDVDGKGIAK